MRFFIYYALKLGCRRLMLFIRIIHNKTEANKCGSNRDEMQGPFFSVALLSILHASVLVMPLLHSCHRC